MASLFLYPRVSFIGSTSWRHELLLGTGRSAHVQQDLRTSVPFQCLNFPFMLQSVSEWESVCYGLLVVLSSFNFLVFMNCPATLHVNDRISSPSNQITVILSRTAHKKHVYKSSLCKYSPHINSHVLFHIPLKKVPSKPLSSTQPWLFFAVQASADFAKQNKQGNTSAYLIFMGIFIGIWSDLREYLYIYILFI